MKNSAVLSPDPHSVLLINNRYLISGGESKVFDAEQDLLRERGHDVQTYIEDNRIVAEIGATRTALRSIWSQQAYRTVREVLRNSQTDIVHVHNLFPLISPAVYYAAHTEGIPVVQTLHNFRLICLNGILFRDGGVCEDCVSRSIPWPGVNHSCYKDSRAGSLAVATMLSIHRGVRTWNRVVDTYIALTDFSRQKLVAGGLPDDKIVVKPNFLLKDPGQGSGDGHYVLFVGRLSPEKGINTLLEAWKLLGESIPLKVVGEGPLQEKVIAAAASQPSIEFLGKLDTDAVMNLMQQATFLVFPSLVYENFPITIIEAFATGLPVLASALGNPAFIVESKKTGFHFHPGDPQDLAKEANALFHDEDGLYTMRNTARATFEAKYTAEVNYRMLMDIYNRAIQRSHNGTSELG